MERLFVYSKGFDRKLKEIKGYSEIEMSIETAILGDPEIGELIEGTHGLRKFRVAFGSKGKSGGIRVLYFDLKSVKKTYLIAFFHKNEKDNLSKAERNEIGKIIVNIKEEAEKRGTNERK